MLTLEILVPIPHVQNTPLNHLLTGSCTAVSNMSGYRCESDCRSRGLEFDAGLVPYFHGDCT